MTGEVELILTAHCLLAIVCSVLLDRHLVLVSLCCRAAVGVSASGIVAHSRVLSDLRAHLVWRLRAWLLILLLTASLRSTAWSDEK